MTDKSLEPPVQKARSPLAEAWDMFRGNHAAMAGFAVLILIVLAAIFGPLLYPTVVLLEPNLLQVQGKQLELVVILLTLERTDADVVAIAPCSLLGCIINEQHLLQIVSCP